MRNLLLCPRLALGNLQKNRREYLPFLGAAALMVYLFFTVCTIATAEDFGRNIPYGGYIQVLLIIAVVLLPVVCGPFLWYINSFLMKRRKKELGLYGVLGLEQRHVGAVLFYETLLSCLLSLGAGLLLGAALMGATVRLLLGFAGVRADVTVAFSPTAALITAGLFGAIFLGCFVGNLVHLSLAAPVNLLKEDRRGEKDPRFGPVWAALGTLCLGGGYAMALTAKMDSGIFGVFFFASLLVALGTYGLFISGSIYLIKWLKGRKGFYYQPQNFVTLAGMLHRMRKNGAGLANICIFSTMTLVTLACTAAVWLGQEEVLAMAEAGAENLGVGLNLALLSREELVLEFGTLAFLGVFFGVAFFLCTLLVMYYKQITEGHEDQGRFLVMRQVGMGSGMVRRTVRRQITLVFALPLLGSLVHMAFATPLVIQLLWVLRIGAATAGLALGCSALVFILLYLGAYLVTARAYYRIVR